MYFAVRTAKVPDPYYATLELYPGALFGLLALFAFRGKPTEPIDMSPKVWGPMLFFNAVVGFVGYAMRFYAIPKVTTATFSILSFVGVVASFIFGWLFAGEKPSALTIAGAGLITAAAGLVGQPF
jgi:drug/metabolite transporter (DMT)-like permease